MAAYNTLQHTNCFGLARNRYTSWPRPTSFAHAQCARIAISACPLTVISACMRLYARLLIRYVHTYIQRSYIHHYTYNIQYTHTASLTFLSLPPLLPVPPASEKGRSRPDGGPLPPRTRPSLCGARWVVILCCCAATLLAFFSALSPFLRFFLGRSLPCSFSLSLPLPLRLALLPDMSVATR